MTVSFGGDGNFNDGGGGGDFDISYGGGGGGADFGGFDVVTWDDYQRFLEDDTGQAIPTLRNVPTFDSGATSETTVNNPDNLGNYNQTSTTTGNGASGVATYNQGWSEGQTDYNVGATDSAVLNNFEQQAVFDYSALDANAKLDIDVQVTSDFLTATDKYDTNTAAGLRGLAIAAAKAEDLLATDAFGTGLTSGDRADLQRTIDRADAAKINIVDTVDKVTNFLQVLQQSESANNEDRSVFTRADGAIIAQQFIDSLSPAEFAIVKNIPELDSALGKAQNPGRVTYGSESIGPTFLGSKIADAIELGTTLNGGPLTETQINKITDTIVDGYRILQNNDALDLGVQSPNAASGLLNNVKYTIPDGLASSTAPELNAGPFSDTELQSYIQFTPFDSTQDLQYAGTFGDIKKLLKIGDTLTDESLSTQQKVIEILRYVPSLQPAFRAYDIFNSVYDGIKDLTKPDETLDPALLQINVPNFDGPAITLAALDTGTTSDAGTGYSFARRQSLDSFADSPPVPQGLIEQIQSQTQAAQQLPTQAEREAARDQILLTYSAVALATALPEYGTVSSWGNAKVQAETTVSNNGASTGNGVTSVPGVQVAENGVVRRVDRGLVEGSPEWNERYAAEYQAADALSKKIFFEVAAKYGQTTGIVSVPVTSADGKLTGTAIEIGPNQWVDISAELQVLADKYGFKGYPEEYSPIKVGQTTTTYSTPWREVVIQAPPKATTVVSTSQGDITVDPNSEVARFIQWQASQYGIAGTETVGEKWAAQGVFDPYSDPEIVKNAIEQIKRANDRIALYAQSGQTAPQTAPWNDPNWPAYQGSNKEAYDSATYALSNADYRNKLMAENGWDQATFDSWALRITDPDAWAAQAAAIDAANGVVVGPSGSSTSLSSNKSTVVTSTGVNAQGFPNATVQSVATNTLVNTATGGATAAVQSVNTLLTTPTQIDPSKIFSGLTGAAAAAAGVTAASTLIGNILKTPTQLPTSVSPFVQAATDAIGLPNLSAVENLFNNQASTLSLAQAQATLQARYNQSASTDWRVRLQLAPGADYLYKDPEPGILAPLFDTDGVLFPYTPTIETSYAASYDKYDLTHSNYRGYFYKGSAVNDINLRATFTAQDTQEANYMLAVIHFFRSVTKMFYGQDAIRGAPPPLVYLTGFGEYQFNQHPCLVASFNYTLPSDVDYIRALAPNNYGNLFSQRDRTGSTSGGFLGPTATRLVNAGLNALNPTQPNVPSPQYIPNAVNGTQQATYVPTKIDISLTLLPTNTRSQVSQQFSLKDFANGNLIKGGFW